jgi:hypothetical protein
MGTPARLCVSLAVLLGAAPALVAQTRGHQSAPVRVIVPATRRATQMRPAVTTTPGTRIVVLNSTATPITPDLLLGIFPTPGLGFDYVHLAAINHGAGVRALIDPITQHELALARAIRRETPGFVATFPTFFGETPVITVEPSIVVVQQPAPPPVPAENTEKSRAANAEPPPPVEPLRDAGDFVLVRRDAGLLFAVAFTTGSDRLTYVTHEGVRRTLPLAELDFDATERINEERGTPLQLPQTQTRR